MQVNHVALRRLLDSTIQYQIPLFQRPYSWEKKNWQTLWDDLISIYNDKVEDSYFLGSIVTQSLPGVPGSISPFLVIDGQQRLTTLTILLALLRNRLKKTDPKEADKIQASYLINQFESNDNFYKVLPTQSDRQIYETLIKGDELIKKEGRIYESYHFFDEKIKKAKDSIDCIKLKNIILEKLMIVNITTEERDNPYLIFESLNNKGQELTQVDLIRNYIFMKLDADERQKIYDEKWLPFIKNFQRSMGEEEYTPELTNAFYFYARKDGQVVNQKEIYKIIKNLFENSTNGVKDELNQLIQFTEYYQRLNFPHKEPNLDLRERFERLRKLEFTTCHIFLLNVYHQYEQESITIEQFLEILSCLESYFVRRLLVGIPTNILGTVFTSLYSEVMRQDKNNLVNGLKQVLKSFDDKKAWPDDRELWKGMLVKSIYTSGTKERTKLLLWSLESYLNRETVDLNKVTIEHIMPQSLTSEWKNMLGDNASSVHKKWLHTLGNLTLTGYNSEMGNKPFSYKLN
ncbi:DUF262 domain-containing protein [Sphaerospermopsis sp. LEGE 08334]|uniref:DUF262 domain-containing protein n=1 Tax=Sphaerospermopsis sp. LEGE 08334 TaxID=1828651 RepID=UPI00187EB51C|nr:DUF262 domain-containing protein [Sphaerospermopsis sp. LEGE 08334]MBE9057128.1 DUF262 domain-containing protein [Sphaerospermopsis sp. LEGE 08334]